MIQDAVEMEGRNSVCCLSGTFTFLKKKKKKELKFCLKYGKDQLAKIS